MVYSAIFELTRTALAALTFATMVSLTSETSFGDCKEETGFYCVHFLCDPGSGFTCLLEFDKLKDKNPKPRGESGEHKPYEGSVIKGFPAKKHKGWFVKLHIGMGIDNLKVPEGFELVVDAMGGTSTTFKVKHSGHILCTGGFLEPWCDYFYQKSNSGK